MSELGERVARAYGDDTSQLICGVCSGWPCYEPDNHRKSHTNSYSFPDPENSWEDFGALLEWASEQKISVELGLGDSRRIRGSGWFSAWKGGSEQGGEAERLAGWPEIRRGVVEAILKAAEGAD